MISYSLNAAVARSRGINRKGEDGKPLLPHGCRRLGTGLPDPIFRTCQFIAGDVTPDDSCKCGQPTIDGLPYCADHAARCYQKPEKEATA